MLMRKRYKRIYDILAHEQTMRKPRPKQSENIMFKGYAIRAPIRCIRIQQIKLWGWVADYRVYTNRFDGFGIIAYILYILIGNILYYHSKCIMSIFRYLTLQMYRYLYINKTRRLIGRINDFTIIYTLMIVIYI